MNDIIFPKQIIKTLKDVYGIEKSEAISEIDFAVSAIDLNSKKRTFQIIIYDVEDSEDSFEIYIKENSYFIGYLGDEIQYNFIDKSYDFDPETKEVFSKSISELIL